RIVHDVGDVDGVEGADDESVAHAIKRLEHEQSACPLIRQLHLRCERRAQTSEPAREDITTAAVHVAADYSGPVECKHGPRIHTMTCATVDDHDLILANHSSAVLRAVHHRDDATAYIAARSAQHEVNRDLRVG